MTYTVIQLSYFGLMAAILAWGGTLAWRWYRLPGFAAEVYDSNVEKELLDPRIDRDAYIASFIKAEGPRLGTYRCLMAFISLLLLPLLIAFFSNLLGNAFFEAELDMGPYDLAQIAMDFLVLLIVMGIFGGGLFLVTAYYYRTRPPSLKTEVRRLEAELNER